MRRLALTLAACPLLSMFACARGDQPKQPVEQSAQSSWFIESYENGVVTAKHDGHVYRATCVDTSSYAKDYSDVARTPNCSLSIELVGHQLKAFGDQSVKPDNCCGTNGGVSSASHPSTSRPY